jgi:peptidoglycan-N-acetylglucosamine deacetylase
MSPRLDGSCAPPRVSTGRAFFTTSWDDGDISDLRVAELLTAFGLRGTFYASTGPTGSRLIEDDPLAQIGLTHELGNHGRTHTPFVLLSEKLLREELIWGGSDLRRLSGTTPTMVAPPQGKISANVVRVARELGLGVRTAPILGTGGIWHGSLDPTAMFYPHRTRSLATNAYRRRAVPMIPLLLSWTRSTEFRTRMREVIRSAVSMTRCVHLWGHSEEVERLDLWTELEDVFALASNLPVTAVTNGEAFAFFQTSRV